MSATTVCETPTFPETVQLMVSLHQYYTLRDDGENRFTLSLLNDRRDVVYRETYPVQPTVTLVKPSIVEIRLSLGSPNSYVRFFDIATGRMSPVYENPLYTEHGIVAYREGDRLLHIADIFDANVMHIQLERSFSPTAVPHHAILGVRMLEDGRLEITYLKGGEFLETVEIIDFCCQ